MSFSNKKKINFFYWEKFILLGKIKFCLFPNLENSCHTLKDVIQHSHIIMVGNNLTISVNKIILNTWGNILFENENSFIPDFERFFMPLYYNTTFQVLSEQFNDTVINLQCEKVCRWCWNSNFILKNRLTMVAEYKNIP